MFTPGNQNLVYYIVNWILVLLCEHQSELNSKISNGLTGTNDHTRKPRTNYVIVTWILVLWCEHNCKIQLLVICNCNCYFLWPSNCNSNCFFFYRVMTSYFQLLFSYFIQQKSKKFCKKKTKIMIIPGFLKIYANQNAHFVL